MVDRIRSVLVATDLAESTDIVLRAGGALAALTDAQLHVLHAFELDLEMYTLGVSETPTFQGRVKAAERMLEAQLRRALPQTVNVASSEVVIYAAHKAITERRLAVGADLIVLGRHRPRPVADAFLGSTADRIVRTAKVPCLIIDAPLSLPLHSVVVPTDLSPPSLAALDVALSWTAALSGGDDADHPELSVMHVVPRVLDIGDEHFDDGPVRARIRAEIDAAVARVSGADGVHVHEEVCRGDDATAEILRVLDDKKPDLVVLATHGRGAVERALIGSVTSGVARAAPCPVLLVPPS